MTAAFHRETPIDRPDDRSVDGAPVAAVGSEGTSTVPEGFPELRAPVRRHSDLRIAVFRGIMKACAGLGGRAFYRRTRLRAGRFRIREERLRVAALPGGLDGLRIAQLSDLHGGPFLSGGDLRWVVEALNELRVDLVVITGDWITSSWREALPLMEDLEGLEAPLGCFGVFGNHDYRGREEQRIADAARSVGVKILRNECVRLDTGEGVLGLVGLEDLEESKRVDVEAARRDLREGDVEVVLCHHPLGGPALARPGCVAVLSGHTHGRQVDLPGLRGMGPPHPGLRIELGVTTLIVNRGLGVVGIPLRVGAPSEIVVVRLESAGGAP